MVRPVKRSTPGDLPLIGRQLSQYGACKCVT